MLMQLFPYRRTRLLSTRHLVFLFPKMKGWLNKVLHNSWCGRKIKPCFNSCPNTEKGEDIHCSGSMRNKKLILHDVIHSCMQFHPVYMYISSFQIKASCVYEGCYSYSERQCKLHHFHQELSTLSLCREGQDYTHVQNLILLSFGKWGVGHCAWSVSTWNTTKCKAASQDMQTGQGDVRCDFHTESKWRLHWNSD